MTTKLYFMSVSHPSQVARKMLELKGVEHELVNVLPFNQRLHLRLAGFPGGTVPALKLDGRRVQGSREIGQALDELFPDPLLVPIDPELRMRVLEAERWGEQQLQPVPRRIARFGAARHRWIRRWAAEDQSLPVPSLSAHLSGPIAAYYARTVEADGRRGDEVGIKADLAALPGMLDHVDALLADGTLATDPPNGATLQILSSVRLLEELEDVRGLVSERPCAAVARELFPAYRVSFPAFLPHDWLPAA